MWQGYYLTSKNAINAFVLSGYCPPAFRRLQVPVSVYTSHIITRPPFTSRVMPLM